MLNNLLASLLVSGPKGNVPGTGIENVSSRELAEQKRIQLIHYIS